MQFPIDWQNEDRLRAAFSYAVRVGVARAFGTVPVGWYQIHVCKAFSIMEARARKVTGLETGDVRIRLHHGMLQAMQLGPRGTRVWRTFGTPSEIFAEADKAARS